MSEKIDNKLTISLELERIFYFVYPEGRSLNEEATQRIAKQIAEYLEIDVYGTKSGPCVQNPATLFKELNEVGLYNAEIVLINESTQNTIVLSGVSKEKFLEALEYSEVNSGLVAIKFLDDDYFYEEEAIDEE